MFRMFRIACVCSLSALVFSCTKADKKDADESATTKAAKTATDKAATPEGDELAALDLPKIEGPVAIVNGVEIPAKIFLAEMGGTLERYRRARHPVKPQLRERLKDNLVRRLIDAEIIRQKAKEMKVDILDKDFDGKWAVHKKRYGTAEAFEAFLARTGETVERMQTQFRLNLIREQVFAKVSDNVVVSAEDMQAFYKKNKDKYNEQEKIKASHILLRTDAKSSPADKEKKQKLANKVRALAAKKGADFGKLAEQYGEDPTKTRGGDLGYFTKGRMVKAFEEAAWKLKTGEVSAVVPTQFGYHIIKKTDHQNAAQKSFMDVKDQIARTVRAQKRNNSVREALTNWRKAAKIEIFVKGDPAIINQGRNQLQINKAGLNQPIQVMPKQKPTKTP